MVHHDILETEFRPKINFVARWWGLLALVQERQALLEKRAAHFRELHHIDLAIAGAVMIAHDVGKAHVRTQEDGFARGLWGLAGLKEIDALLEELLAYHRKLLHAQHAIAALIVVNENVHQADVWAEEDGITLWLLLG